MSRIYDENFWKKIIKLIKDPRNQSKNIFPYLKGMYIRLRRKVFELFGSPKYSKPFGGEEILIKNINIKNGFFIQVGGFDGYFQDPTYYLEKFLGWNGLIIEPLSIAKLCQKNRKRSIVCNVAAVSTEDSGKNIEFVDCSAMSFVEKKVKDKHWQITESERIQKTTSQKINVRGLSLQTILHLYNLNKQKIDLLSIDVEDAEVYVLQGLDFNKNAPNFILAEAKTEELLNELNLYLKDKNYILTESPVKDNYLFKKIETNK